MRANSDCTTLSAFTYNPLLTVFAFRAAVDSVLSITYGITPTSFEHPFIQVTEAVNAIFADVAKGRYLGELTLQKKGSLFRISFSRYFSIPEIPSRLDSWCHLLGGR